jgi:hypothetical protein
MIQYGWMLVAALIAFGKGRSIIGWSIITYIFSFWAIIGLLILKTRKEVLQNRITTLDAMVEQIEQSKTPKDFKDFNTVDDLIGQLQQKSKGTDNGLPNL